MKILNIKLVKKNTNNLFNLLIIKLFYNCILVLDHKTT